MKHFKRTALAGVINLALFGIPDAHADTERDKQAGADARNPYAEGYSSQEDILRDLLRNQDAAAIFNELTREVNDYYWFAATLNVLWAAPGSLARRVTTLRGLLERVNRFEIGIDRSLGVEPVVRGILERTLAGARSS